MRLRTIALTMALACGFTVAGQAKKNTIQPASKAIKVKKFKKFKAKKFKHQKMAKVKHH